MLVRPGGFVASDFANLPTASRLVVPAGTDIGEAIYTHVSAGFWVEPEYDGMRCQAMLTESGWVFAGKTPSSAARQEYVNIPKRCPSVAVELGAAGLPCGTLLDGKLTCVDGHQPLLRHLSCPAERFVELPAERFRLAVFDVLEFGCDRTDTWPLFERQQLLKSVLPNDGVFVPASKTGDEGLGFGLELLHDEMVDGILLRRIASQYPSGNTKDWFVYRRTETHDAVVMAVSEGRGKFRGMAGSLVVGQYFPDGKLRRVASIDGMTVDQRNYAWAHRSKLIATAVSFVSKGRTETSYRWPRLFCFQSEVDPKSCQWSNDMLKDG